MSLHSGHKWCISQFSQDRVSGQCVGFGTVHSCEVDKSDDDNKSLSISSSVWFIEKSSREYKSSCLVPNPSVLNKIQMKV